MSDANIRDLERRAYDSEEDFLRYSAARLRAGLGPVEIQIPVDKVALNGGRSLRSPAKVYLTARTSGWAFLSVYGLPGSYPFLASTLGRSGPRWHEGATSAAHTSDPAHADEEARKRATWQIKGKIERENPPGRDDAIKGAFREWQAGDDASLERLMAERARAGLDPKPEHPELKNMLAGAKAVGWNGKKRMTGKQAEAALMYELKRRGWHVDRQPSQVSFNIHVWISPDSQRRVTFNAKSVTWEKGGRGHWTKDYGIHIHGQAMSTIDAAHNLMLKKAAKPLTREEWTDPMQNPGADERMRKLERAAKSGDEEAAMRLAHEQTRTGTLSTYTAVLERLKTAVLKADEIHPLGDGTVAIRTWSEVDGIGPLQRLLLVRKMLEEDGRFNTSVPFRRDMDNYDRGFQMQVYLKDGSPVQNPPDKDVLYSLASLAQHGRTSSTIPALVKITGRPQHHVEQVVQALAQRGLVAVRGPLVIFDRRIVALVAGAPAVRKAANPPGADNEIRTLQRAVLSGDVEAGVRLASPEYAARYRGNNMKRNPGFAVLIMTPISGSRPRYGTRPGSRDFTKAKVTQWMANLFLPDDNWYTEYHSSKKACLGAPMRRLVPTGILTDKVLVIENYDSTNLPPGIKGKTKAWYQDYPGLTAAVAAKAARLAARTPQEKFNDDMYQMTNPGAGVEVLPLKAWLKEAKSPSRYTYCGYSRVSDGEDLPCGSPPVYAVIHRAGVGKTYAMAVCGKHQSWGKKAISGSTRSNPSPDERLRALQRAAAGGDEEARQRLAAERRRTGTQPVRLTLQRLRDTGEWRVNYWINGKRDDDKSYYADDKVDAVQTMALMQAQIDSGQDSSYWSVVYPEKKANPSPDERRRALQRQAQRELDTYGESAPDTLDRLTADAKRTEVPKLGERAYLRDILAAWGIGEHGTGWVSVGVASKGLQAVFKKAGIKAEFKSSSYSMGSHISITTPYASGHKMAALLGLPERGRAAGDGHVNVHPNAREDKTDSQTDYFEPGGVTLPAEYYQTYAEAVQKALGSKDGAAKKKEAVAAAKKAERDSATTLDETYGAPVEGKRYLFDLTGRMGGVWQSGRDIETGPENRGRIYEFTRVGKRGELLNALSGNNHLWLSWKEWQRALKSKIVKYGPTSNPGMATLGWATNPGSGLSLAQARKRIGKTDPATLIAQTRPRDRDKLKAEIAHASRQKNPDDRLRKLERAAKAGDTEAAERLRRERARSGVPGAEMQVWHQPVDIPSSWLAYLGPSYRQREDVEAEDDRSTPGTNGGPRVLATLWRGCEDVYVQILSDPDSDNEAHGYFGRGDLIDGAVITLKEGEGSPVSLRVRIVSDNPKKNPGSTASVGRQKGGAWKTVSLETAIGRYKIDKIPSFKKALAHYRKFHKADPHSVRICVRQNDDGKNKQMVVTDMGEVPETQYIVKDGKDSNKAGHHWVHKHREKGKGTNPQLVFDPVSGTMMIVGGTYKVTDWIRN